MTYVEHIIANAVSSIKSSNSEEDWIRIEQETNNKYAELSEDELCLIWETANYILKNF